VPVALGQLLRLREMIRSAASSIEPDGDGAAALTDGYMRLRGMVRDLVDGSSATVQEFDTAFPEIETVQIEPHEHPRNMGLRATRFAPHARQAKALLGQLEGWVSGLIAEFEYEGSRDRD
jgi:hypothetical protein